MSLVQATETIDGWSDAETLLLLEAVALYGEKWQAVGAYVGSKNQLQCVTRFLSLPVDEASVDALERPDLRPTRVLPPADAQSTGRHGAQSSSVCLKPYAHLDSQKNTCVSATSRIVGLYTGRQDATCCCTAGATLAEVQGPIPFQETGNPVMAQLAFLATMLSPRIAAAAAQRALEVSAGLMSDVRTASLAWVW